MSLYDLQVEEGTAFGRWYGGDGGAAGGGDRAPGRGRGGGAAATRAPPPIPSRPSLPSSEDTAFMYAYASGYLRSRGYEHYEISSYARRRRDDDNDDDDDDDDDEWGGGGRRRRGRKGPGNRSVHNQIYWEYDGRWHAVGLGATSNVDGGRYARPRAMSDYISWTEELGRRAVAATAGTAAGDARATNTTTTGAAPASPWLRGGTGVDAGGHRRDVDDDDDDDDDDDRLLDIVMTRLRTSEGLDLDWIAGHDNYDGTHVEAVLRGFELALDLKLGRRDAGASGGTYGSIRLNDPKGFLFSNHIISNIFLELSEMDSGRVRDPLRATLSCE